MNKKNVCAFRIYLKNQLLCSTGHEIKKKYFPTGLNYLFFILN